MRRRAAPWINRGRAHGCATNGRSGGLGRGWTGVDQMAVPWMDKGGEEDFVGAGAEGCAMDGQGWSGGLRHGWTGVLRKAAEGWKWNRWLRGERGADCFTKVKVELAAAP